MAEITETNAGKLSSVEWMTTLAFLGALYCVMLGIFKRFSANFSIDRRNNEERGEVQQRIGVYRNYEYTTYSQISEVQSVPAHSIVGSPNAEMDTSGSIDNNTVSGANTDPKLKLPIVQGVKVKKKQAAPEIPEASTSLIVQPNKKKSTKGSAPPKPTNGKDNKSKDENAKIKDKLKKEKAEQLKQDKKLLEKRDKEEKARKEKEAKEKEKEKEKEKGKKDKTKKAKAPLKPVTGVITENPVNNATAVPKNVPAVLDNSKQGQKNLTGSLQELSAKPAAVNNSFTSSWDLVAEHRQNMQRELQTINPGKNLRSIASQNTDPKREVKTASNISSGGFNILQRHSSDGSDMDNTDA